MYRPALVFCYKSPQMKKTTRPRKSARTAVSPAGVIAMPDASRVEQIRSQLLMWYRKHRRDLPWRRQKPDAYHVMVSEAMLQQTQVATVIAYFHRFIDALPTVQDLARASEQQVLTLWQGLGYYRRARNLHAAAKAIVADHGGVVPRTVEELLQLPGVGRYTAGAIASIAYGQPAPIVDGNVVRILARIFAITQSPDEPAVKEALWQLAALLVPEDAAGDFNQSMMELGAMVCSPRSPQCLICPVNDLCQARQQGLVESLPVKVERKKPAQVQHHILAVQAGDQWYFEQRPATGLWSNMWQLPTAEDPDLDADNPTAGLQGWLQETRRLSVTGLEEVGRFTHQTTHKTITFILWKSQLAGKRAKEATPASAWRNLKDLTDLPLPNPQKKAVKWLEEKGE